MKKKLLAIGMLFRTVCMFPQSGNDIMVTSPRVKYLCFNKDSNDQRWEEGSLETAWSKAMEEQSKRVAEGQAPFDAIVVDFSTPGFMLRYVLYEDEFRVYSVLSAPRRRIDRDTIRMIWGGWIETFRTTADELPPRYPPDRTGLNAYFYNTIKSVYDLQRYGY